jgi:16S rRNA processing protein RimM
LLLADAERVPERVIVGTVGKPHGLDGTVVVHPETDNPDRFGPGHKVHDDSGRQLTVRRSQQIKAVLLVSFAEIIDREGAEALRGSSLTIGPRDRRRLAEDEFWPEDLIGLEVRDSEGERIGVVSAVDPDSPQHRLTITTESGAYLVPLVDYLVPRIDLVDRVLVVNPIAGLFDHVNE